jgi:hypothetical protein
MSYRIAGIVHKKMLAVVVSDVEVDGEFQFERRMFGSNPEQLRSLAAWLVEQEVEEESWNRRLNIGDQCGKCWNDIGSRSARSSKALAVKRGRCIWRKQSPIAGGGDGRGTLRMPNAW